MNYINKDFNDIRLDFTMKRLGSNIRKSREYRKLSQQELAELAGTSQSVIHDLERKTNYDPRLFTLIRVASVLNLTIGDLFKVDLWGSSEV